MTAILQIPSNQSSTVAVVTMIMSIGVVDDAIESSRVQTRLIIRRVGGKRTLFDR